MRMQKKDSTSSGCAVLLKAGHRSAPDCSVCCADGAALGEGSGPVEGSGEAEVFGAGAADERELKITIPENLDYDGLFDDLFEKYTGSADLERVKTTNMGTLYELSYRIVLRDAKMTKAFLDELRTRNGNLTIVCGKPAEKASL